MSLGEYRRKRDFKKTREPSVGVNDRRAREKAPGGGPSRLLVVQKHAATNLHYDLRLQFGDVLRSWAVPKGPSFDPKEKRLAVLVEDHPLEYGSFEGTIPKGEYGGGTVMLWDTGTWTPLGDAEADFAKGDLKFIARGQRLCGLWMLVRTGRKGAKQEQWLLFKERDAEASPAVSADSFTTSIATGRTMEEIAAGAPARSTATPKNPAEAGVGMSALAGAKPLAAPLTKPQVQLASPASAVPEGSDWLYEVKFDGYRLLAVKTGETVKLITRRGNDWTSRFPQIAGAVKVAFAEDAVLDGEAVVLDSRGISDFQALQNAQRRKDAPVVFMAFDLLWLAGQDLRGCRLEDRKGALKGLIGERQEGRVRFSRHHAGDADALLRTAYSSGLEGLVSKHRGSPYTPGRSPAWIKVKCFYKQEFVIGGYTQPTGTRVGLGAVLVGYYDGAGKLVYAGRVGTGFSTATLKDLTRRLKASERKTTPFAAVPSDAETRAARWVDPVLVAEVKFLAWSEDEMLRHPSFVGLREDQDPKAVKREAVEPITPPAPAPVPADRRSQQQLKRAPSRARPAPAAVRLTSPDRVVYPDRGAGYSVTKRRLAEYYEAVADLILPHIAGRPLAIVRCPDGEGGPCFFQKHPMAGMPKAIGSARVATEEGEQEHLVIEDAAGLLGLVQMGALEIHPWGSTAKSPEKPDRLVFDLDPGPGVEWREVVRGALMVREALTQMKLTGFPRTTGGNGLHVVVPIQPRYTWQRATAFCRAVAETLVRLAPARFVATSAKAARAGKIYMDYLRNTRGATAVGPYSTRARPGAPVATPLAWEEVNETLRPGAFTAMSVPARASTVRDPWETMANSAGRVPDGV